MKVLEYGDKGFCAECKGECIVIGLDIAFDYDGPMGTTKTHYPAGHGDPVSDCHGAEVYEYLNEDEQ